MGIAKARKAVEHSIVVAAYHILDRQVPYEDLGADEIMGPAEARRRPTLVL